MVEEWRERERGKQVKFKSGQRYTTGFAIISNIRKKTPTYSRINVYLSSMPQTNKRRLGSFLFEGKEVEDKQQQQQQLTPYMHHTKQNMEF